MGRTAGIMGKTVEDIEAIGAYLDSLPPKETKKRMVENKSEAVALLQKNIEAMRQRGYSLEDIATILAERGVEIASPTLKSYLQRAKGAKKKPTKSTTKPAAVQERGSVAAKAAASLGSSVDASPTSGTMTPRPDRAQI
ncbi:protein mobC [Burkholderia multivorans]|uniref:protein mobC n=1 Tax=Burkholderia multivorans TaxID=87883 RepID=UPI001C23B5B0|nr:protein mobC [Burkholderia multivorans]MBU9439568.1 protein mobC [Burkholderia multivorans]